MKAKNKMGLICVKWAPTALEYMKFLERYGLEPVGLMCDDSEKGPNIKIFANEDKYLKLALDNKKFIQEEKQLCELFEIIERLSILLFLALVEDEYDEYDEYEDYMG